MRKYELDGRTVKISQALTAEERFDKKRLGYVKYAINKSTGIRLHWDTNEPGKREASQFTVNSRPKSKAMDFCNTTSMEMSKEKYKISWTSG